MSESVQSDIKLSFKCTLFSDFCPIRLIQVKATSHAMSKMILTLTSVAHYQLFLYLNKKCRDLTAVYNRSVIKFVPCGRPPRRLSVDMYGIKKKKKKNSSDPASMGKWVPYGQNQGIMPKLDPMWVPYRIFSPCETHMGPI